jgi:phage tail sheath protein FI
MAFSVSPSVIVREVDASAAVPAIATPPAAMAGVFRWGPVGETILVSSENELISRFGKPSDNNYETFFTAADYLAYSNALWLVRVNNGAETASASNKTNANTALWTHGAFDALYPGAIGNSLEVAYVKGSRFEETLVEVGDISSSKLTGNTQIDQTIAFNASSTTFELLPADRITVANVAVGDILTLGNDSVGYQEVSITSIAETALDSNGDETANSATLAAYSYTIGFSPSYRLAATDLNTMSFTRKWKYASLFGKAPQANNYHIAVIDGDGTIVGEADGTIEIFADVSTSNTATLSDGTSNYYVDVIANRSSWVQVANTAYFEAATSEYETLARGTDGDSESATTLGPLAAGYDLFKSANEIDVAFILQGKGDQAATLANYIISNIADYRRDAVAFLSPSKADVVDENKTNTQLANVIAYRNKLQNSSYWFMDSGYKYRYDKYNDKYRWVPLNGDIAGLASRVEPFESPAGFRKGVIKNVVKLAFNPNKTQRDQLYSADVNPVMSQVGQGIVLFGDKTGLGLTSAFDRLNVRRLFIAVEKAIANAAQSFLFELNDEFSQTQFRNIVEPFLREIQGRRGIIDFRVISDSTVNTPAIVDQGKFRANIFIKPARSINVIELTFVATRTGIEFEEIVGSIT